MGAAKGKAIASGLAAILVGLGPAALARATPSLFMSEPVVDRPASEIQFALGARPTGTGRTIIDRVRVELGSSEVVPARAEPFQDAASGPGQPRRARPSMAIALVFFWGEGAPQEILDGVPTLFKRLPPTATVYPFPYGEGAPSFVTPRTADSIAGGDLDTIPTITGTRPVLGQAVRFAAAELGKDRSPLRFMIIVTDGRDQVLGADPPAFQRMGAELLQQGLVVEVVAFAAPFDGPGHAANAQALAAGAGGAVLRARSKSELPRTIEQASLPFVDLQMVFAPLPLRARVFGARLPLRASALIEGTWAVAVGAQPVSVSAWSPSWLALGGLAVVALALAATGGALVWRRRPGRGADDRGSLIEETQRLVRLGAPADRIVVELSRRFPQEIGQLARIDPGGLDPAKFAHLRTRAGRAVLDDVLRALAAADEGKEEGEADLVGQLAAAVGSGASASEASTRLRARLPERVWSAFARSSFREIAGLLRKAAPSYPALATPQARKLVLQVQDALRSERVEGALVAWLVRAAGPGSRGKTLRLAADRTTIGRAKDCQVILAEDALVAEHHAVISQEQGIFSITPAEGTVKVESQLVEGQRHLADGETLELGTGAYVFKSAVMV
jgi:hypothetical protein